MFRVPAGERSPRVTLLQILLNSHACADAGGQRLTVDGVYGQKTRAALASATKLMRVGDPTGAVATPELVKAMLKDVDLTVITSVDLGDPNLQADVDVFKKDGNVPILLGGMCNGLQEMIRSVTARARPGRVAELRFDGHGNLGRWLTISVGSIAHLPKAEYQQIEKEINSYISATNFDQVSRLIAPLRTVFAPFGFVEHLGCTLGAVAGTRGMLKKLANLWGVPIRVGVKTQPIGTVTVVGQDFVAYPKSLDLRSWSQQFDKLDLPGLSRGQ